jgi:hypothetical protein
VLQFNRHVALAVALPVAPAVGEVLGTMHADWQLDPWELQPIMQLVTVEVCASRIGPANALAAMALITTTATRNVKPRMTVSAAPGNFRHDSAVGGAAVRGGCATLVTRAAEAAGSVHA